MRQGLVALSLCDQIPAASTTGTCTHASGLQRALVRG